MIDVAVSSRGVDRWRAGHPWIYRSDVRGEPSPAEPGIARVLDASGQRVGTALYSPASEIRLRLLERRDVPVDEAWWTESIARSARQRAGIEATAFRLVHAEADGLPSLIIDRYGAYASVQLLSAGLEAVRDRVLAAIRAALEPGAIVLRNDVPIRRHEGLPRVVETLGSEIPPEVEVETDGIRYLVDLVGGQKTGSFLDQRENRWLAGQVARGRALDLFCYEGGFALHMARAAEVVVAVDQSGPALTRTLRNAALNGIQNIETMEANAFDLVNDPARMDPGFDTIVIDPPAFARSRKAVPRALAGYKELNLRALRALRPDGHLLTFSCSYHVSPEAFLDMLRDAAADAGRRAVLVSRLGASRDHPALLTVPESEYLKGALVTVAE